MISLLRDKLQHNIPFAFTKFGDGEIICILKMFNEGDKNCDYQSYSKKLTDKLIDSLKYYSRKENIFIGEWNYGDVYESRFKEFILQNEIKLNNVPYATLLHIEGADLVELKSFYSVLKTINNKVYVCPDKLNIATELLNCDLMNVKERDAFSEYELIKEKLINSNYDFYLYSCGLMSKVLIADILKQKPNTTHIDIGSGMDNLFVGFTRLNQISIEDMKKIYEL